mgnify:CR=1 FL=1
MKRWITILIGLPAMSAFFLWELVLANLKVARDVLAPVERLRPAVVAVPLDLKTDWQITLLAILITLTPGTLSLDVSTDRKVLFVHAMHVGDPAALRHEIKSGFERLIGRLAP